MFEHYIQVREREQLNQVCPAFGQPTEPDLYDAELALEGLKLVFNLGAGVGFDLLDLFLDSTQQCVLVQHLELDQSYRDVQVHALKFEIKCSALRYDPITRLCEETDLITAQQCGRLFGFMAVGCVGGDAVHQSQIEISASNGFYTKLALLSLLGLAHLGFELPVMALAGAGRCIQGCVNHCELLKKQDLGYQCGVDLGQEFYIQMSVFNRCGNHKMVHSLARWSSYLSSIVNLRTIGTSQGGLYITESDRLNQYCYSWMRSMFSTEKASVNSAMRRCMCSHKCHQFRLRHIQLHLVEEFALTHPLGRALEVVLAKAHLFHTDTVVHPLVIADQFFTPSLSIITNRGHV